MHETQHTSTGCKKKKCDFTTSDGKEIVLQVALNGVESTEYNVDASVKI